MSTCARIKGLRVLHGWSREQFSSALGGGYPYRRIQEWECGTTAPRTHDLPRIAKVLNVSIDYLLTGEESPFAGVHRAISQ